MTNNAPIGVFDSGFGGLTVARAIIDQLPAESIRYVGDTSRGPYGPLPIAQVREYSLEIMDGLVDDGVKALVIACNSASAATLRDARERYEVPVIEGVHPAVRRAELMVRIKGTEEYSKLLDHEAWFFTLTTPSRFHCSYKSGLPNPKYDGCTPKQANDYLNKQWSKARAQFACNFFACAGFDVEDHNGFETVEEGVQFVTEKNAKIVVVCSSEITLKCMASGFVLL